MQYKVNHLTIQTLTGRFLINDLSFSIGQGDKIAVIGEEGNGKTTLIQALCDPDKIQSFAQVSLETQGFNAPFPYLHQVLLDDELALNPFDFMKTLTQYPMEDHWEDILFHCAQLKLPQSIFHPSRTMRSLSGGERIKVQIIGLLIANPPILVLDEPTNDLDLATLIWLENFCIQFKQPILFVSHDELFLSRVANRVIHLEQLRKKQNPRHTVANVPYLIYVEQRIDAMEKQTQMALSERREVEKKQKILRKFHDKLEHQLKLAVRQPTWGRLLAKKMKVVKGQEKKLRENPLTDYPEYEEAINVFFDGIEPLNSSKRIVEIQHEPLVIDSHILVSDIELTIIGNTHVAFVGANGVGKTTLLKNLHNRITQVAGLKVGYFPQHYLELLEENKTPVEYLSQLYGSSKDALTTIRSFLGALHLTTDEMSHLIGSLSGGQKAKIVLLKLILERPNVLLLDEPSRNFSPLSAPEIREMLSQFPGCLIMVSHDRLLIEEVAEIVYELTPGGLIEIRM